MAAMKPLIPAIEEALPAEGWKLVALDAGRYAAGLQSTVELWNGSAVHTELLHLANPESWAAFKAAVVAPVGCTEGSVHAAILSLKTAIEGQLRTRRRPRGSTPGMPRKQPSWWHWRPRPTFPHTGGRGLRHD